MARYVTYEIGGERYMVWALNGNLYAQHIGYPMTTATLRIDGDEIDDRAICRAITTAYGI